MGLKPVFLRRLYIKLKLLRGGEYGFLNLFKVYRVSLNDFFGVADLQYERLKMSARKTSIYKAFGF
jgi:hypothetical protein